MRTVVAFGETLWDLLPEGPLLGGAPCNFAYRVGSLGERGVLVTRLGEDDLGRQAQERLLALGMDTRYVQWDPVHPTGTVQVHVDARGIPDFTIVPDVAFDAIEAAPALLDLASQADCVCFGTLIQRSRVSRRTLYRLLDAAPRALKLLDVNLRKGCFSRDTIEESLRKADLVKLNDQEALELKHLLGLRSKSVAGLARELRRGWSLDACVVTLGERGALAVTRREETAVPGWTVPVKDTIGSGDAFTAAFVSSWMRGRALEECCFFGNVLGAMVARTAGATSPISREEIRRFSGRII
jgi:fructokinase